MTDKGNGDLRAQVSQSLDVEFEAGEEMLEQMAACMKRSGKIRLIVRDLGIAELGKGAVSADVITD